MVKNKIKAYRVNAGMSQLELANILKVSRYCVIQWEKQIFQPGIGSCFKLKNVFGIEISDLFDFLEDDE